MEYGVLGPLTIGSDERTATVGGARRRALVAALVAQRGRTVAADDLVDALWPDDPPPSARHTLHTHVSRLRQELGVPVDSQDGGYRLADDDAQVDAERFDQWLAEAETSDDGRAVELLAAALDLWRGPAFGGAAAVGVVRGEAQRLTERRLLARELLVTRLVGAGRAVDAVPLAEGLTAEEPARESAWAALIRALVAAGRPADGVGAYARASAALDELGLRPSATLRAAQAEALGAPTPPPTQGRSTSPAPSGPEPIAGADANPPVERPIGRATTTVPTLPSSLVGREGDIGAVERLLDRARLVTLVGPGGVGKTRLALEVARRRASRHRSGARVVELTTLSDPASVPAAVLAALGVGTQGGPVEPALRRAGDMDTLVLLDNCEHVVDSAAEVLEHLLLGRRVTVMATSREPVGLPGEHVHVVDPLTTRGGHPAARRLFVERALAAGVSGGQDALDPVLVDRVVRLLDGLPLAIEMAAARTATTALPDLAAALERELDDELARMRDPRRRGADRHRTLRAVIAWSEAVLPPDEHDALVRWPVFSGPVEAQDAAAVVDAPPEVVEALVRRSLLMLSPETVDGRGRYRMLHTVRSAVQAGSGVDLSGTRERHAHHLLDVTVAADRMMRTPAEPRAVARLGSLVAELRTAHAWAREHDLPLAALLSRGLHGFAVNTLDDEVLGWAARLAPLLGRDDGLSTAHLGIAARMVKAGELGPAIERATRALELARDDVERLQALDVLTDAPIYDGRFADCRRNAAALAELALQVGDPTYVTAAGVSSALTRTYEGDTAGGRAELVRTRTLLAERFDALAPSNQGWLEYTAGEAEVEDDPTLALAHFARAVDLADLAGNRYLGGVVRVSTASVLARHADPAQAVPAFEEVIRWWLDRADRTHLVTTLRNLVDLMLRLGSHRAAAELWAAVSPTQVSLSFGPERERLDRAREELATHLSRDELDHALAAGAARDLDAGAQAALDALRLTGAGGRSGTSRARPGAPRPG